MSAMGTMGGLAPSIGFRPSYCPFIYFNDNDSGTETKPKPKVRRTLRTVSILFDAHHKLQGAKINMSTGEVLPHTYKDYYDGKLKARRNPDAPDIEPFWMQPLDGKGVIATTGDTKATPEKDKSRKKLPNGAKEHLEQYVYLRDAIEDYPSLDHIMCGATSLDLGGNTRGLNRQHLFTMLQNLDAITPETVRSFAGHSKSHSEKVAACLRIIVHGFMASVRAVDRQRNPNLT